MTTTRLLIAFASLIGIYSLLLFIGYRPLTRQEGLRLFQSKKPVETTTIEERSRGESSYIIRKDYRASITRKGFLMFSLFGYIAISLGFTVAVYFVLSDSPRMNSLMTFSKFLRCLTRAVQGLYRRVPEA